MGWREGMQNYQWEVLSRERILGYGFDEKKGSSPYFPAGFSDFRCALFNPEPLVSTLRTTQEVTKVT